MLDFAWCETEMCLCCQEKLMDGLEGLTERRSSLMVLLYGARHEICRTKVSALLYRPVRRAQATGSECQLLYLYV